MEMLLKNELGRGFVGIIISIGITFAALVPILLMELFSKLFVLP